MLNINEIDQAIDELLPEITKIRKFLHARPELSLKEHKTSEFIRIQLSELDVELLSPFLETDVVALLDGQKGNKRSKRKQRNVTLRADMDALPIVEKNTILYCSNNKGVMHACGHDGHTAMLLGAAMVLEKFKDHLDGSVRFVFQPGEEVVAAGKDLIEMGILKSPKPIAVLALHGWPGYPVGVIGSRPGGLMAAADFYRIKLTGKGGHGSASGQQNNPVVIGSKIVTALSSIPEREFSDEDSVVISINKITGGTASNVIPNEVIIQGSTRFFEKTVGKKIPGLFEQVLKTECEHTEISYELKYDRPYIPTVNDPEIIKACKTLTQQYLGESAWIDMDKPVMASEDFSYYIDRNPGAMFFLGMGEDSPGLHTNTYNFNDEALKNGIKFFVLSAFHFLSPETIVRSEDL
jgi:amidohydrolase